MQLFILNYSQPYNQLSVKILPPITNLTTEQIFCIFEHIFAPDIALI